MASGTLWLLLQEGEHTTCTVYSIKTETFYGRSTSTGTGVLIYAYGRTSLWIRAQHSKGTGVDGRRSTGVGTAMGVERTLVRLRA